MGPACGVEALPFLLAFLGMTLLGVLAGSVTGLAPGLHVNNLAALVLATQTSWATAISLLFAGAELEADLVAGLLSCFLVSAAMSHGIFDFIPSTFLGAPNEETALSILPGHRMLLRGDGARAVALAARGALLGVLVSAALLLPLRILLSEPVGLAERFRPFTPAFLLALLAALLATEALTPGRRGRRVVRAGWVQVLAGILGIAVLRGPSALPSDVALFPLFSGLFGLPGLIVAIRSRPALIPPQNVDPMGPFSREEIRPVLRGSLAGAAVSWLPGLSGGAAATLASIGQRRRFDPAPFMVVLGSVSTSTAVLSVAVLFIIGRARSGTAVAVQGLIGVAPTWSVAWAPPEFLLLLVAAAALAACVAAPLATSLARRIASRWSSINSRRLAAATLVAIVALLAIISGFPGLVVTAVASLVGLVPVRAGVRRVHLMAALLVSVILKTL